MKSFGSCLTFVLVGLLLFVTGYFSAQHTIQTVEQPVLAQPSATPVWASFPSSAVTPYVTEAIYQPFEHGFMLWRADYNCAYAIRTDVPDSPHVAIIPQAIPADPGSMIHAYGYCLAVTPLTDQVLDAEAPAGFIVPTRVLGLVWRYYAEIRTRLGYATAPEQHYTATVPTNDGAAIMDGSPFTRAQMTLPDGTVLACGSRAATAGTCQSIPH